MSLTFDAATHRYTLDGRVVPSVTGILKASGAIDFSGIPDAVLEAARYRGTIVHQAIHYLNDRDLDLDQFRADFPAYVGYVDAWLSFCAQRSFESVLSEHRIASRRLQVAGTFDSLGLLDGIPYLLDYATGRPIDVSKDYQTAAYLGLAFEWQADDEPLAAFFAKHPLVRRAAVALRADGTFRFEVYSDPGDFRKFSTLAEGRRIVAARRGEVALLEAA